jgi:hypothetical protein
MMFKIEMENWLMVHEAITNDFETALDDLAVAIDDESANGHIIDLETGEVLVQISEGNVVYIAPVVLAEMVEAIAEDDPFLAMMMTIAMMIEE